MIITSKDNETIKSIKKLKEKKYRTESFIVEGIKMVKPGNRIGDISASVYKYAKEHNLGVVRELCGHGIGTEMHEDPEVPNFGIPHTGITLKPGMVICIEPMLTFGKRYVYQDDDGWTVHTEDGSPAAHYEHTIAITNEGPIILTGVINNG